MVCLPVSCVSVWFTVLSGRLCPCRLQIESLQNFLQVFLGALISCTGDPSEALWCCILCLHQLSHLSGLVKERISHGPLIGANIYWILENIPTFLEIGFVIQFRISLVFFSYLTEFSSGGAVCLVFFNHTPAQFLFLLSASLILFWFLFPMHCFFLNLN